MAATSIGPEMVLVDGESGMVHALNPSAALVWQCFDGESPLAEIIADLAYVLDASTAKLEADVVAMTRAAAEAGLLEGVEPLAADRIAGDLGVARGERIEVPLPPSEAGANRKLLINWSASCGFCASILPQLSALQPLLQQSGTSIVLVDGLTAEASVQQAGQHGLDTVIVTDGVQTASGVDLFAGMGTPVAYVLDEEDRVASARAYGGDSVLALARMAGESGATDRGPEAAVPDFLPALGGVCGPRPRRATGRPFQPTGAYEVGSFRVGIQANSPWAEAVVSQALARYRLGGKATAPDNFSVILHEDGAPGRRNLNVLLAGGLLVARSRSPHRVLTALAGHLSCLLDPEPGLHRLDAIGAVVHGQAFLLPKTKSLWQPERLQAPLARMGVALLDEPFAHVDPDHAQLVVKAPRIILDGKSLAALADPPRGRSEPASVLPGRYPLRSWVLPTSKGGFSPAGALTGALAVLVGEGDDVVSAIGSFVSLLERVEVVPVLPDDPDAVLRTLEKMIAASSVS